MQFQLGQLAGAGPGTQGQLLSCRSRRAIAPPARGSQPAPQAKYRAPGKRRPPLATCSRPSSSPRRSLAFPRQLHALQLPEYPPASGPGGPENSPSPPPPARPPLDACPGSRASVLPASRVASSSARVVVHAASSLEAGLRARQCFSQGRVVQVGCPGDIPRHSSWEHGWHRKRSLPGAGDTGPLLRS